VNKLKLSLSGIVIFILGFMAGIYTLPIMIAPEPLSMLELATASQNARYKVMISDDLDGSDFLHNGTGEFYLSPSKIVFKGSLTPGPDYQLYLSKQFVENEEQFKQHQNSMINIAEVKRFDGFIKQVPDQLDIDEYTTIVIWCEAFEEFITAAKYKG
jgi:hypothetical protein